MGKLKEVSPKRLLLSLMFPREKVQTALCLISIPGVVQIQSRKCRTKTPPPHLEVSSQPICRCTHCCKPAGERTSDIVLIIGPHSHADL